MIQRFDPKDLPINMRELPLDKRGFPVPWFVAWIDGEWDFRVIRPGGIDIALRRDTCWLCGRALGRLRVFAVGPMCTVNRITSEPPSHPECARFAVVACPFLSNPKAKRPDKPSPADVKVAGTMLPHNPGVTALWATDRQRLRTFPAGDGFLIELPRPEWVEWWTEGRKASRDDVDQAMVSGLPNLEKLAVQQGSAAIQELAMLAEQAKRYFPEPTP